MDYKQIANEYLKIVGQNDWFEGAILCGSFVAGNNNQNSDIDLYIVSNNNQDWRERGNKLFMGKIIEYFINPVQKIEQYFQKEAESAHKSASYMFANGVIIADKHGEVAKLQAKAQVFLQKPCKISDFDYKNNCYHVWDSFDELDGKYREGLDIDFSYYNFLGGIINAYLSNKFGMELAVNKIEKLFLDKDFRRKYFKKEMHFGEQFEELAIKCLKEKGKHQKYKNASNLYNFFMREFNDFDINNYSLVSSI